MPQPARFEREPARRFVGISIAGAPVPVLSALVLALGVAFLRLQPASSGLETHPLHPRAAAAAGDNVILIIGDDMGVETLRAYGEGDNPAHTPTLDALIDEGLLFRNAWAYPLCTPFRASVLTGRYGFRTGVGTVGNGPAAELPYDELIIPEVLDANPALGVAHAAIGKWHLSPLRGNNANTAPTRHGFGHFTGILGVPADYYAWERVAGGSAATSTEYVTSVQVDDALDWLATQDGPFFLYLAFSAPHAPFHRPPDGMYSQTLPPGEFQRGMDAKPYFLAAIEALDHELGRLLANMDPAQRALTNVIFMGDNGSPGQAVQAPFERTRSKSTLYQGGIWTPLLVSGPAVAEPGRVEEALVSGSDLFATVLELLDVEPHSWASQTDSLSLLPYLQEPGRPPLRDWTFSEQFGGADRPEEDGKTIRDARYKYLRFDDGREALYDLQEDPYESRNLLEGELDADAAAALDRLEGQLDRLLADPPATPSPVAQASLTPATAAPASPAPATPTTAARETPTVVETTMRRFVPLVVYGNMPALPIATAIATEAPLPTATPSATADATEESCRPSEFQGPVDRSHLPLGDSRVLRRDRGDLQPEVGALWLCGVPPDGRGNDDASDWSNPDGSWDFDRKPTVDGRVDFDSVFQVTLDSLGQRLITGNALPSIPTGVFPIDRNSIAYRYDPNPSHIEPHDVNLRFPALPQPAASPRCVGYGATGISLTGNAIYHGASTLGNDAAAHEMLDAFGGQSDGTTTYHTHFLTDEMLDRLDSCEPGHSALMGYILDGFGIYGPRGEDGKILTSQDLDPCHGHSHPLLWDGEMVDLYHYHWTYDFPYNVGCFKGTPVKAWN